MIAPLGLQPVGTAVLTGICRGDVVRADVVSLQLKFVDGQHYVPIGCAVCDQLSNSLILGADIVDKLQLQWLLDQSGVCDDVVSCDRDEVALNADEVKGNDVCVADEVHVDDNNEDGVMSMM